MKLLSKQQMTFEQASDLAHAALDEWMSGSTLLDASHSPRPDKYEKHPAVIHLGYKLSRAMTKAYNLRPSQPKSETVDVVDEFYSLPPRCRTKANLRRMIEKASS